MSKHYLIPILATLLILVLAQQGGQGASSGSLNVVDVPADGENVPPTPDSPTPSLQQPSNRVQSAGQAAPPPNIESNMNVNTPERGPEPVPVNPSISVNPESVPSQPSQPTQPNGQIEPGLDMNSLSEEQKQKLLEEEAILTAFHNDPSNDFSKYANMTPEQAKQAQQKMKEEAERSYQQAMKEMQERERKSNQEMERMIKEQKLTQTQKISHRENVEFKERQDAFNPRKYGAGGDYTFRHQFNEYMFELETGESTEFGIHLPIDQKVALYIYTYTNKDGVYTLAKELQGEKPADIQIFQNNNRVLARQSFFFKKYMIFEGKENFSYTIKIGNPGVSRLFALNVVNLLQRTHIAHTLDAQAVASHGSRAQSMYEQLQAKIQQSERGRLMEGSNSHRVQQGIRRYYLYSILEIIIVAGVCIGQIKMIQKLLKQASVV